MRYVLNAESMKAVDSYSINHIGIPSVVLMEKAALSVTKRVIERLSYPVQTKGRILCVCGAGNNGADGLAVARQLYLKGYEVDVFALKAKHFTEEYTLQLNIIKNLGIQCIDDPVFLQYGVIVDAMFGNGLSRNLEGEALNIVKNINEASKAGAYVIAVDIPSGISATTGKVMADAIKADMTVTFGYEKIGQLLYPGTLYCGELVIEDIGFALYPDMDKNIFTFEQQDIKNHMPQRKPDSNKGSCGKVLAVAGSRQYAGAALLTSRAAYRMGSGLVKVFTHKANRDIVITGNIECLFEDYSDETNQDTLIKALEQSSEWSDAICIGPGLSKDKTACELVKAIGKMSDKKRLFDADALNIIAADNYENIIDYKEQDGCSNVVVTPHIAEMARLTGITVDKIKDDLIGTAVKYAAKNHCICVLKDARTIVSDGERVYINSSGNDGMATGGSGDVLSGIITALMSQGLDCFKASALGVYIHGMAGDKARDNKNRYSMVASDIIANIENVL